MRFDSNMTDVLIIKFFPAYYELSVSPAFIRWGAGGGGATAELPIPKA